MAFSILSSVCHLCPRLSHAFTRSPHPARPQEQLAKAEALKTEGNRCFTEQDYDQAIVGCL
jgi:hypothetical protein